MATPSYDFSTTVKVLVGSFEEVFVVHPSVLCARSEFFEVALAERWNSTGEPVKRPEDDASVFNEYLKFVYNKGEEGVVLPKDHDRAAIESMVKAYILADKLNDPTTANSIIDEIIRRYYFTNDLPTPAVVALVFEETPESSPLRRYIVDSFVYEGSIWGLESCENVAPSEFFSAIAKEQIRLRTEAAANYMLGDVYGKNLTRKCLYHMHDNSHPACIVD